MCQRMCLTIRFGAYCAPLLQSQRRSWTTLVVSKVSMYASTSIAESLTVLEAEGQGLRSFFLSLALFSWNQGKPRISLLPDSSLTGLPLLLLVRA